MRAILFLIAFLFSCVAQASIWEESRDYKFLNASTTYASGSLGPGAKTTDGDVLSRVIITPLTTAAGSVAIYDGSTGTAYTIFQGGSGSKADLSPVYLELNARAKNPNAAAGGPRWIIQTGANVTVMAVGTFH